MPTVLIVEGYRFFFFSNEGNEASHIHVEKGDGYAKFWLNPLALAYSAGFKRQELKRTRELVDEHEAVFLEKWNEYFGDHKPTSTTVQVVRLATDPRCLVEVTVIANIP